MTRAEPRPQQQTPRPPSREAPEPAWRFRDWAAI